MSHTTTLKPNIRKAQAIRKAVTELQRQGVKVELLTDAVPRMFFATQHPQKSEFVLKLEGRYDVGLDKQKDGTYALAFDAWGGDIHRQLGNNKVKGNESTVAKFLQEYGKQATILAAQEKGYMVAGCTMDAKGNYNLVLNIPN